MVRQIDPPVVYPVSSPDVSAELDWLANHSAPFAGEWVALSGAKLVAHGPDGSSVFQQARAAGIDEPFLAQVPADPALPFAGW